MKPTGLAVSSLLVLGGASACQSNPNKQVESARAAQMEGQQEAARERDRLAREQQEESDELAREQMQEGEPVSERMEEQGELASEQAEEQGELRTEQLEEQKENVQDVREATTQATRAQREYANAARERLRAVQQRARQLRERTAGSQGEATATLNTLPERMQETERDIEALETIQTANFQQKKTQVDRKLSSLESSLDRVEMRR